MGKPTGFMEYQRELPADLRLDFLVHFVEEGGLLGRLLAQNEQHCALDVVAFLHGGISLGCDTPRGRHSQSRSPEDQRQIRPDTRVLVGEHDDLQAVVRHVRCQVPVTIHHAPAEALVRAGHGEGAAGVSIPVSEKPRQRPAHPGQEKLRQFVVVDRVRCCRSVCPITSSIMGIRPYFCANADSTAKVSPPRFAGAFQT